jgi:hypothetical protein
MYIFRISAIYLMYIGVYQLYITYKSTVYLSGEGYTNDIRKIFIQSLHFQILTRLIFRDFGIPTINRNIAIQWELQKLKYLQISRTNLLR